MYKWNLNLVYNMPKSYTITTSKGNGTIVIQGIPEHDVIEDQLYKMTEFKEALDMLKAIKVLKP